MVGMSLLRRLMLFVILAMLPIAAVETYNQIAIRKARALEVRQQVLSAATLIDAAQEQIIQSVRQVLSILRHSPVILSGNFPACQSALAQAKQGFPNYINVQVTDVNGVIRCATDAPAIGIDIADRPHVLDALQSDRFTVGEYIRVRSTGQPALPFAIRYTGADGRAGVVTAYLTLSWLSEFLRTHPLPENAATVIADRAGVILGRLPELPGILGTPLPERYKPLLTAPAASTTELVDLQGIERVFGYMPAGKGAEGLFVAVGVDRAAVMAPITDAAIRFAASALLLVIAGLLLVWYDVQRQVATPVAAMLAATTRWRGGDHTARAALTRGSAEIVELGRAFDAMADDLENEERTRKQAEAALRLSEARLRSIVDTAVDAFVVIDAKGMIRSVNRAAERLFGHPAEAMVGNNVRMLMPEPDRSRHDAYVANYLHTGERRIIGIGRDVVGLRQDGSTFPLELSIAEWEVAGERRFTGIMRDITQRREAEDHLRQAKGEAERANLAKSKFLAAASHDLRQPLQSTYLFMEVIRARVKDERTVVAVEHVQTGLNALTDLLNRLLDVSRLDAGAVHPRVQPVRLDTVLADLTAGYAAMAAAKEIDWRVKGCAMLVQTDPVLLSQMLRNLADNAVKYTERGSIHIECFKAENHARIVMRDTGIGIPLEHIKEIFEEFHQVGNPERDRTKGLGLGLAIVRRLSRLLDHPVEVRSNPGIGTEFCVILPISAESVQANDNSDEENHEVTRGLLNRFVVLVDDDAFVLTALEAILISWGFEVLAVPSSEAAVERLQLIDKRPDMIISDYRLRNGKVGTAAVKAIRDTIGADIPALIITGETGGDALRDAAEHRLPVLHKPVPPGILRQEMTRRIGNQ